jgi:L-fucose mutarotase
MLIGIDPLLSGELLKLLDEMGHGDEIAVVDCNYPAFTPGRPVVQLGDVTVTRAIQAILSVLPLDESAPSPVECMRSAAGALTGGQLEVLAAARQADNRDLQLALIDRFDFYRRAATVTAIVRTLDPRPYGCFILHKGVVTPRLPRPGLAGADHGAVAAAGGDAPDGRPLRVLRRAAAPCPAAGLDRPPITDTPVLPVVTVERGACLAVPAHPGLASRPGPAHGRLPAAGEGFQNIGCRVTCPSRELPRGMAPPGTPRRRCPASAALYSANFSDSRQHKHEQTGGCAEPFP